MGEDVDAKIRIAMVHGHLLDQPVEALDGGYVVQPPVVGVHVIRTARESRRLPRIRPLIAADRFQRFQQRAVEIPAHSLAEDVEGLHVVGDRIQSVWVDGDLHVGVAAEQQREPRSGPDLLAGGPPAKLGAEGAGNDDQRRLILGHRNRLIEPLQRRLAELRAAGGGASHRR